MKWYKDFYAGASVAAGKEKIKWKILHHAGQLNIYVIVVGSSPSNLLDIISSTALMQRGYPRENLLIVGVDRGYDNAVELAAGIVLDIYHKTGDFKVREYFLQKHKAYDRRAPVWESC